MESLLEYTGAQVTQQNGSTKVHAKSLDRPEAPYDVVKTMRASSLVLGPLVARTGRARVSMPGGCAIGARPINMHVSALENLGATIEQAYGYVEAQAPNGLRGGPVNFDRITVTGTEDVLMAAVLARGETVINNAAREPEVQDLANLLIAMGAKIEGAGTSVIKVQGVEKLHGAEHTIIPDRIEAGTFMLAGAISRGEVVVTGCNPEHVAALTAKMQQAGAEVDQPQSDVLRVRSSRRPKALDMKTEEYPGFATDLQAAVYGLDDDRVRHQFHHRNHLRKSLYARLRVDSNGCQHTSGRTSGHCRGRRYLDGRTSDCFGPARECIARTGGAGGQRPDRD